MIRFFLLGMAVLGATGAGVLAHGGGDMPRPFLQRHAVMGSLAAHMKATKSAIGSGNLKDTARQAEAIYWLARMLPDTFPKGSGPEMGKTRAEPKIWQDWQGFLAASDRLADTASALRKAAHGGNREATDAAFKAVGREGCGGCHKAYRAPKR